MDGMKGMPADGERLRIREDGAILLQQREVIGNERVIRVRIEGLEHRRRLAGIGPCRDDKCPVVGHQAGAMHERVPAADKLPPEHWLNGVCVEHMGRGAEERRRDDARLLPKLDARHFKQIHRSTIVNLDRVREIRPEWHGDYDVQLTTGDVLRLGRRYRDGLLK